VTIALTAAFLHGEKVRFPVTIVFTEVNTRIELLRHWFRLMSYALLSQISGHYCCRKS
jgi:hypothetical protein